MEYMTNKQLFERYAQLQLEMNEVLSEVRARNFAWQHLAHEGLFAQAVMVYRDKHKVGASEALAAIRAFQKEVSES